MDTNLVLKVDISLTSEDDLSGPEQFTCIKDFKYNLEQEIDNLLPNLDFRYDSSVDISWDTRISIET